MQGFPPTPDDQVSLDNWQEAPYNRWSFSHMREVVPTQKIRGSTGSSKPIPFGLQPALGKLSVRRSDGARSDLQTVLQETYTDGVVVVHGGQVVLEQHFGETRRDTPHLLMSITKSVVGCVTANLVERGTLSPDDFVTKHVPELENSGYNGATVRNVLDMRSGIKFSEEYANPDAEVRVMEEAFGWRPPSADRDTPRSMYEYLTTLSQDEDHGGPFHYRSCETHVLGWVCERASGERMSDLISEMLWQPMGAEFDAEITCDSTGAAIHDGGMSAATRDLARFGVMLLSGGKYFDHQVVPANWLRASWSVDPDIRDAFSRSDSGPYLPGGWYRNQFWFLPREHGDVMLCLGINGQMLYISPGTGTVAAKLSSWPEAQSPVMLYDTLQAFDAVGAELAGLTAKRVTREGPPGIAAGLAR